MLILAFDTTAARCAAALWRDGTVLAARAEAMEQGHAEALVPMIQVVMGEAGHDIIEVDRIAVTVGPGSFTGVRVGLATARAMGLAAERPVIGVSTTEALAAWAAEAMRDKLDSSRRILAAIDTRRGDLYAQVFDASARPLDEPCVAAPADLPALTGGAPVVAVGDGARAAAQALSRTAAAKADVFPEPAVVARIAATRAPASGGPLPLYLRPPEAALPKDGGRLRP